MKIIADSHIPFIKEYFNAYGDLILKSGRDISARDVKDADILLVRSITPVNQELLLGSSVKFVGSVTAGSDHLDTKWLDEANIAWSIAYGFNAPPVSDYVVCVIAALQKQNLLTQQTLRAAVVGVGNVGSAVAERLNLLNFQLELCDPLRAEREHDIPFSTIDDISDMDLILLHVPLTKLGTYPTYHFIDKNFLKRQKKECILLNASRGSVIHFKDLMQYGKQLHWCFDVWANEPNIDRNILKNCLIATPHIAGYSVQSKIRGIDMIYHIACEKKIIKPHTISPQTMPHQQLDFSGHKKCWQDVVLHVFNPKSMTDMMRETLARPASIGNLFDEMRNQFNYRYEFAYTKLVNVDLSDVDKKIVKQLGFSF